jgi:hypothetical protein
MISKTYIPMRVVFGLEKAPFHFERAADFQQLGNPVPPLLVEGLLHQGCKMVLAGTSKSNKTWALLDMALSVASGVPWWGFPTCQKPVLYINFELPRWAVDSRLTALYTARPELLPGMQSLFLLNLRGKATDFSLLRPSLDAALEESEHGLIIIDPAYKLLGDRDENSNSDITSLMNEFERLSESTGAAVVIAHHFAKGDASGKFAMDRMSGAGAWARDPDAIMVMTPHEEEDCYTVSSILRNLPRAEDFVLRWDYPLMTRAKLDPSALRSANTAQKKWTDTEFMEACVPYEATPLKKIVEAAKDQGGTLSTVKRYLKRLIEHGLIRYHGGLYWRPLPPENGEPAHRLTPL